MRGRSWAPPGYPAPPPATAASGAGHGGSLPSHQRLTPGCCGAATHLPSQRWGAQRGGQGMLAVSGGGAAPRGAPGRGRGSTAVPVRCRSCVCSPRWVPRLDGTGLLGRSGPGASDASAQLRLGAPRGFLPAALRAARSGLHRARLEGLGVLVGSELGGSQPCALAAQDASSISGLHEHDHSAGDRGKGLFPALGARGTVSEYRGRFWDREHSHEGRRATEAAEAEAAARGGKAAGAGLAQPGAEAVSGGPRSTSPEPAGVGIHKAWLLRAVHGARLRDSGREWQQESGHMGNLFHREKQERFKLCIPKGTTLPLTPRRVKQQHRLPWELVQAPSVEVFRTRPDKALSNLGRPRSCPGCEQEVALGPSSGLSQPGFPLPLRGERAAQQGPRGSRPPTLGTGRPRSHTRRGAGEGPAAARQPRAAGPGSPSAAEGTGR